MCVSAYVRARVCAVRISRFTWFLARRQCTSPNARLLLKYFVRSNSRSLAHRSKPMRDLVLIDMADDVEVKLVLFERTFMNAMDDCHVCTSTVHTLVSLHTLHWNDRPNRLSVE